jgi:hypothetical protein
MGLWRGSDEPPCLRKFTSSVVRNRLWSIP